MVTMRRLDSQSRLLFSPAEHGRLAACKTLAKSRFERSLGPRKRPSPTTNCYIRVRHRHGAGREEIDDRERLLLRFAGGQETGELLLMNYYIFASGTDTRPDRTNLTSENASCSGSPAANAQRAATAMPPAERSQTALPAGGASPAVAL